MTFLAPKRYVASVDCIDLDELYRSGKRALLVDRDNTLVPRDAASAPPEARDWLDRARRLGFRVCLVSNNWYRNQVQASARELGIDHVIWCAMKPAPFALWAGLHKLSATRSESLLVATSSIRMCSLRAWRASILFWLNRRRMLICGTPTRSAFSSAVRFATFHARKGAMAYDDQG